MNLIKLLLIIISLGFYSNLWAQVDDKQAFKQLKQLQGTWVMNQAGESIYAKWWIENKRILYLNEFKIVQNDTVFIRKAYIHYSPFERFIHPSSTHFNVLIMDKQFTTYRTHRLEEIKNNTFFFTNLDDEITLELNKNTYRIQFNEVEKKVVEQFIFQKLKIE
jgi:nitrate reductase gamma subunit